MNKTNTAKYLPFQCISPNLVKNPDFPDYPYLRGTGFFCKFPPYDYIFYVTARHCLLNDNESEIKEFLKIPYSEKSSTEPPKAIVFSEYLSTVDKSEKNNEDILIFVVDNKCITEEEKETLNRRSLSLRHQDDIDTLIKMLCDNNENIRTIGFSQPNSDENDEHTSISYEENQQLIARPRGFYGKIRKTSKFENRYGFEESNWKDEEYRGFSGSPVLALLPINFTSVQPIIIGVMLTATKTRGEFLSINVATNLIAAYINNKQSQKA
jgi:hypothetical protein